MDSRQKTITKHFTREQLLGMKAGELADLIGRAGDKATFRGTAVVRGPDGKIKYDAKAVPGDFHESPEDLAQVTTE
ncbi:MAG: hypothetical protein IIB57_03590 [Planctomycetes bacterium]|nr:hypothetical protein [Planctomycetota bacterium]